MPQLLQYFGGQINNPLITILKAVDNKELKASALMKNSIGLSSMMFVKNDFLAWYERYKVGGTLLSVPALAKLLGLNQEFTYQMVQEGIIEKTMNTNSRTNRISEQNIEDFKDHYVLLSKLAKNIQMSSRKLINYLACREIYPVDYGWEIKLRQKIYQKEKLINVELLSDFV